MKFFICLFAIAAVVVNCASGSPAGAAASNGASASNAEVESASALDAQAANQGLTELTRLRKAAYGGGSSGGYGGGATASIPAPPCPKNYLFSCQPNLAPVPCSAPAASYGSAGAYSSPVATYVNPNYGTAQQYLNAAAYLPQAYAYQY